MAKAVKWFVLEVVGKQQKGVQTEKENTMVSIGDTKHTE